MTEPQYLFVSAISSLPFALFLLFYFTTLYKSFFDLGCCVLVASRSHLVGCHLQQFLSRLLVHRIRQSRLLVNRFQQSRLGCNTKKYSKNVAVKGFRVWT